MLLHKVISFVDDFLDYISSLNRSNITDYCDIEAPNSNLTFVAKDGSLGTILEVKGVHRTLTVAEYQYKILNKLNMLLSPNFNNKKGHAIQFFYSSDPLNSKNLVKKTMENAVAATKSIGLDLENLLNSKADVLERHIVDEKIYIVLWTTAEALEKTVVQNERKSASRVEAAVYNKIKNDSLDPFKGYKALEQKHIGFIKSVYNSFNDVGLETLILDVKQMCREMRRSVDPSLPSEDWEPILPNQEILPNVRRKYPEKKVFDGMFPKFGWQLMPSNSTEVNDRLVLIGDTLFASCYVDLLPDIKYGVEFNSLCNDMNYERIPWRMSMLMEGDGLSAFGLTKVLAQILRVTNGANNTLIVQAFNMLEEIKEQNISAITQIRMSFATWTKANYILTQKSDKPVLDLDRINFQKEILFRNIKKWHGAEIIESVGDPLDSVLSSSLAIKKGSIATKMAAPLTEILRILPLNRVVSPWQSGGVLFATLEGKLIPYRPYSTLQETFISLIWAPPGAGKSVLMNYLNTGLCLEESNTELPYVRIIDVGQSSYGFVELIKNSLPENKRHLALATRMRNVKENSINVFDTQLGCRTPLPTEEAFLKNFLKLLMADEKGEISPGMGGLIDSLIPEMYLFFSDKKRPKRYAIGFNKLVDKAVLDIGLKVDENTTYWQVVDALFKNNRIVEAKIAQTYAVPILSDATSVLTNSEILKEYYKIVKDGGNEDLIMEFKRGMKEVLERFPLLNDVTKVDFANAKIVSLDLDEVVKGGDPKVVSIMYMIARYILAKDFFVSEEEAMSTPANNLNILNIGVPYQEYRDYHRKGFLKIREDKKRINFDEFHLTRGSKYILEQVEADMRLGRKYNVDITLASQSITDFNDKMLEFASAIYIMNNMPRNIIDNIKNVFDLNETEEQIMSTGLGNRFFLGRFRMGNKYTGREKWASFRIRAWLSPEEIWAYNTTTIDASVRNELYKRWGTKKTLEVLSKLYPNGVSQLLENGVDMNKQSDEEIKSNTTRIIDEIIKNASIAGLINKTIFD